MPTPPSYMSDPDDDDEGFAAGIVRPDAMAAAAAPAVGAAPAPVVAAAAPSADDPSKYQAPTYTPPDRTALRAASDRLAADEQPTSRTANAPKWWDRALGGLAAGAMAFGHIPGAVEAGQAVTNRRYNAAEDDRQQRVRADHAQVAAQQGIVAGSDQDFERSLQSFNAQGLGDQRQSMATQRAAQAQKLEADEEAKRSALAPGSLQPDDPKNPMGAWHGTTIDGKVTRQAQPPDEWLKTPAGVAASRQADVDRIGLKGEQRTYYLANGKLHEPVPVQPRIPSAESDEYAAWTRATTRDNGGKAPTATQIQAYRQNRPEATIAPESGQAIHEKAVADKEQFAAGYQRSEDGREYVPVSGQGPTLTAEQFNRRIDGFRVNANLRSSKYGVRMDDQGNIVNVRNGAPAIAPAPALTQIAQKPSSGGGPPRQLTDPAVARQYLQQAGGDKAKARALAAKDNWKF